MYMIVKGCVSKCLKNENKNIVGFFLNNTIIEKKKKSKKKKLQLQRNCKFHI